MVRGRTSPSEASDSQPRAAASIASSSLDRCLPRDAMSALGSGAVRRHQPRGLLPEVQELRPCGGRLALSHLLAGAWATSTGVTVVARRNLAPETGSLITGQSYRSTGVTGNRAAATTPVPGPIQTQAAVSGAGERRAARAGLALSRAAHRRKPSTGALILPSTNPAR